MTNAQGTRPKKYSYFIGVDVSKHKLDVAIYAGAAFVSHHEIENSTEAINIFLVELKNLPKFTMGKAVFCMETTGFYNRNLLECIRKKRGNAIVENAFHIKNSFGLARGKTDKLDAMRIAQYAYRNRDTLKLWKPRRKELEQLAHLNSLRNRLVRLKKAILQPVKEESVFISRATAVQTSKLCGESSAAIVRDLKRIDAAIDLLIADDALLLRKYKQVISVPQIGRVMAIELLIVTNEFLDITDARKFACYAGIAPFEHASGLFAKKPRLSHIANKRVKAVLHLCALGAIKNDAETKAYFDRKKLQEGKKGPVVVNAIRNKLMKRVFACVKQDRIFQTDYPFVFDSEDRATINSGTEQAALQCHQEESSKGGY